MRSAVIGMSVCYMVLGVFMMMMMIEMNSVTRSDLENICNEAVYQTEITLYESPEVIAGKGMTEAQKNAALEEETTRCLEDYFEGTVSDRDYEVEYVYADYESGFINVIVTAKYNNLIFGEKTVRVSKTMIIDKEKT